MAPKQYTLHAPPGSFRAFKALIAAEYGDVNVTVPEEFDAAAVAKLSPFGRAPVLETEKGAITSSNAICRYLAAIRPETGLLGDSVFEAAEIDSWVDFASNELDLPASVWVYPVVGYMQFSQAAYEKAKADLAASLAALDSHLLTRTFLVTDQVTLADIAVASSLVYPFKLVADKNFLKPFTNVVRWFTTCVKQEEFVAVIGAVTMCKTELKAPGQAEDKKSAGGKKSEKTDKKADKKKGKKEDKPAAPAPVKKVEHPYKIMDREAPSTMIMDTWKKTYSNAATYDESMSKFWETYDMEGFSLWHMVYNYNEENKRTFMVSNAIAGFQQRSDEVRKWCFGVMDVLGTEETTLEIKGVWLLRGDTTAHLIQANDDANWYTWTKLAGKGMPPTEETKKIVRSYWCEENELEGKPIADSAVFK